jgi:hypothetical protein
MDLHPKINCMTIPPVVPVKNCRTISLCGNFSNHLSLTFLIHSSHWFKLNDVIKNCFNPLNTKMLIIYNANMVTLPYIPERNDKTSCNVACFHDVSIGVYIYCINCELCFCIYNSFIKVCQKRQKCRFGTEGLKNL